MKTLNISISESDYKKFGFTSSQLKFADFVGMIKQNLIKSKLQNSLFLAQKSGISAMTDEEINAEIQEARNVGNHN